MRALAPPENRRSSWLDRYDLQGRVLLPQVQTRADRAAGADPADIHPRYVGIVPISGPGELVTVVYRGRELIRPLVAAVFSQERLRLFPSPQPFAMVGVRIVLLARASEACVQGSRTGHDDRWRNRGAATFASRWYCRWWFQQDAILVSPLSASSTMLTGRVLDAVGD